MALATRGTELLQAGRRPPRLGAGQGARAQHHRPRRDGSLRLHQDADHGPARHGPAVPEHDLRPRLAFHGRGVGARPRLRRERVVRAADRGPDGSRLGARGDSPAPTACRSACRPTWPPPRRPTSSPRCARSSARSVGASTRRRGTPTSTGSRRRPGLITARQVLGWATIGGAQVAGIADRTGSLTPGKQADIVIIDGSAVNVAPIIDPVGAVVCAADVSNVKTVMVAGEILKEDFRLKASLDAPRKAVEALARLPRLEVRRPGAGLDRQGHRLIRRHPSGRGRFPRAPAALPAPRDRPHPRRPAGRRDTLASRPRGVTRR